MKSTENSVLNNIDKIHTTTMGFGHIKKNLQLSTEDVVGWCKNKITDKKSLITRKGKNWYVTNDNYVITINAHSYTIITAHVVTKKEALLIAEANNRLSQNVEYISHDDILSDFNISEQDLENIDIELE